MDRLDAVEARSREDFVKHFRQRYGSRLPIWVSIELWEFGTLSVFLEGLKWDDQQVIARRYGLPRPELLTSWMRALNHTRNVCAHHSRLWNRSPADQPKPAKAGEIPLMDHLARDTRAQTRLYAVAAAAQFMLRTISPRSRWSERLKIHAASFPPAPGTTFSQSGFPLDWEALPLWS